MQEPHIWQHRYTDKGIRMARLGLMVPQSHKVGLPHRHVGAMSLDDEDLEVTGLAKGKPKRSDSPITSNFCVISLLWRTFVGP